MNSRNTAKDRGVSTREKYVISELNNRRETAAEATRNLIEAVGGWLVAIFSWLAFEVQT